LGAERSLPLQDYSAGQRRSLSVLLSEETVEVGTGSFVRIPRDTLHAYSNSGDGPARMLVLLTPAGFENFWREIGEPAQQSSAPVAPPPNIIPKIVALAPKYGLEIPSLAQ
jgi:hypothetical protein